MNYVVKKIYHEIELLNEELKILQSECPHSNKKETHGSNTGNLDDNIYWTDFHCLDCDKKWTIRLLNEI